MNLSWAAVIDLLLLFKLSSFANNFCCTYFNNFRTLSFAMNFYDFAQFSRLFFFFKVSVTVILQQPQLMTVHLLFAKTAGLSAFL